MASAARWPAREPRRGGIVSDGNLEFVGECGECGETRCCLKTIAAVVAIDKKKIPPKRPSWDPTHCAVPSIPPQTGAGHKTTRYHRHRPYIPTPAAIQIAYRVVVNAVGPASALIRRQCQNTADVPQNRIHPVRSEKALVTAIVGKNEDPHMHPGRNQAQTEVNDHIFIPAKV